MTGEIRFPKLWIGFLFAGLFLITGVIETMMNPKSTSPLGPFSFLVSIAAVIYWLICIYKVHKLLAEVTLKKYPISPGKAVGYGFIPFYNFYWIFRWPSEIANFVNNVSAAKRIKPWLPGFILFLGLILYRIDATIGLIIDFSVLLWLTKNIKNALAKVTLPIPDYVSRYKAAQLRWWVFVLIALPIIIALLAAIAIPNFLMARLSANESLAEATVKNISAAIEDYAEANKRSYPLDEYELVSGAPPDSAKLYNNKTLQGYSYSLNLSRDGYEITAIPKDCKVTGRKIFKVSTGGIISKEDCK